MSLKAVYASQTLGVYVTGEDLDELLIGYTLLVPLFVGKTMVCYHAVRLELSIDGLEYLSHFLNAEREEIARVKGAADDRDLADRHKIHNREAANG